MIRNASAQMIAVVVAMVVAMPVVVVGAVVVAKAVAVAIVPDVVVVVSWPRWWSALSLTMWPPSVLPTWGHRIGKRKPAQRNMPTTIGTHKETTFGFLIPSDNVRGPSVSNTIVPSNAVNMEAAPATICTITPRDINNTMATNIGLGSAG